MDHNHHFSSILLLYGVLIYTNLSSPFTSRCFPINNNIARSHYFFCRHLIILTAVAPQFLAANNLIHSMRSFRLSVITRPFEKMKKKKKMNNIAYT